MVKNIFDYLLTEDGSLNEDVFDSFSNWMFDGDDPSNELARIFLKWSVLFMIRTAEGRRLDNDIFYDFFQGFDRIDFNSFLDFLSGDAEIAASIEQTLGSDQATKFSGDNQSTFWYFIGIITDHIEKKNLFPEVGEKKSKILPFWKERKPAVRAPESKDQLSDDELAKVTRIFTIILTVLVAAFFLVNLLL